MADVAQMNMVAPDPIDFDKYDDGNKSYGPPPEGRYFGRAPVFPYGDDPEVFTRTKIGYLKIIVDPIELVDGSYKIRFTSLSAKKYSNREGNQILDFIHSCGLDLRPSTDEEYKAAIRQCSGRTCQFGIIWRAWDKAAQAETKGAKNFPVDNNGKPQSWFLGDDGEKVYANADVSYWLSGLPK